MRLSERYRKSPLWLRIAIPAYAVVGIGIGVALLLGWQPDALTAVFAILLAAPLYAGTIMYGIREFSGTVGDDQERDPADALDDDALDDDALDEDPLDEDDDLPRR